MEAGTPEGRRTRAALAEIPARLDRLRVTPLRPLTAITNNRELSPSLPPGYLSPAPSPEEFLIQQRGRKRLPVTWSPDIDLKRSAFESTIRTPPKNPPKLGVTLRSTPRKRLLLGDNERIPLSPEKIDFSDISTPQKFKISSHSQGTPPIKRCRLDRILDDDVDVPIDTALKGLSPSQLIRMIKNITEMHPEIEKEIRRDMPSPELGPLEEKLSYFKSNIYRSIPTSRLVSKTDSPAFSRASTHISSFKKCLIEQGKVLMESQNWESVLNYVFMAWKQVRATPVWDNQSHNTQRKQCFKALAKFCMTALKKGTFQMEFLMETHDKLQGMETDIEDIQSCLTQVNGLLNNTL